MRSTTILGIITGAIVLAAMFLYSPEDLVGLVNPQGLLIVAGGTIAAGLVSFSWRSAGPTWDAWALALWRSHQSTGQMADVLMEAAREAKQRGIAGLDLDKFGARDPYLRLGLQLAADGTEPDKVQEVLTLESAALARRREQAERVFRVMGSFSPMFGLVGTILGLIRMLRNLSDPSQIGSGMAVAQITPFYGVLLAALVFLPLAWKVRELTAYETMRREMILTGVLSIQAGENPQLLREKLDTYTRKGESV